MNANYKELTQKLDLIGGQVQREEQRVKKQEQQAQQVAIDSRAAVERGMRSFLAEGHRQISLERLKRDPLLAFFILANRSIETA